ncbi:hypothetical protein RvY_17576 [Ramazzottius varieornatus]|uniref:Uncharacterized protein n=1 Tax=Ramazzottius varieornatus TaxID=947166 RepID=A0A1D1W8D8_RAMVA|nr:hypothetical protein RvY_17576 [Ramazzottius varieornatus]
MDVLQPNRKTTGSFLVITSSAQAEYLLVNVRFSAKFSLRATKDDTSKFKTQACWTEQSVWSGRQKYFVLFSQAWQANRRPDHYPFMTVLPEGMFPNPAPSTFFIWSAILKSGMPKPPPGIPGIPLALLLAFFGVS